MSNKCESTTGAGRRANGRWLPLADGLMGSTYMRIRVLPDCPCLCSSTSPQNSSPTMGISACEQQALSHVSLTCHCLAQVTSGDKLQLGTGKAEFSTHLPTIRMYISPIGLSLCLQPRHSAGCQLAMLAISCPSTPSTWPGPVQAVPTRTARADKDGPADVSPTIRFIRLCVATHLYWHKRLSNSLPCDLNKPPPPPTPFFCSPRSSRPLRTLDYCF